MTRKGNRYTLTLDLSLWDQTKRRRKLKRVLVFNVQARNASFAFSQWVLVKRGLGTRIVRETDFKVKRRKRAWKRRST